MMGLFVRALPASAGGAAAWLVSPDAPNFPIVKVMLALLAAVLALVAAAVLQPAAAWLFKRTKREASQDGRDAPDQWRSGPWAP